VIFTFRKCPLRGRPRWGTLSADAPHAPLGLGGVSPTPLFYLSSFAMRSTVPVPIPSDLATFKIPIPLLAARSRSNHQML